MSDDVRSGESRAERWYRRMMLAYPARYRHRFADEILDVLMAAGGDARPSMGESWALLRHGLAMRLTVKKAGGTWSRPGAAAAGVLATLVAVMQLQFLLLAGRATVMSDGQSISRAGGQSLTGPVDASWASAVLSLVTWALLVLRRPVMAAVGAWASVAMGVWASRSLFDGLAGWGAPPEATTAQMDAAAAATVEAQGIALLVPGLVLAVLLLRPGNGAEVFGRGRLVIALGVGAVTAVWADRVGLSQVWAVALAAGVLLGAMVRESVLLRGGLLVTYAFGYLMVAGLADGSGSRLPNTGTGLVVALALLPLVVFLAGVLVVRRIDDNVGRKQAFGRWIESFGRSVQSVDPPGRP